MSSPNQNSGTAIAMSGKTKGKQKKKGEKLDLDLSFPNWASMMEADGDEDIVKPSYNLPEAPKAISNEIDITKIPNVPPFRVWLRNLSSEIELEDLQQHFKNLQVSDIQFKKDTRISFKTAVVEFGSKQDLSSAISMNRPIRGRHFQMSLDYVENKYNDRAGGDRRGMRGFGNRDDTPNDWRTMRDTVPPKSVYPPPTSDYGSQNRLSGGMNTGGYSKVLRAGNRYPPPSNMDDDHHQSQQQSRNDFGRNRGDYEHYPNRGGYDDRSGNYGGGRRGNDQNYTSRGGNGNWNRGGNDRMMSSQTPFSSSSSNDQEINWRDRSAAPPPPPPPSGDYESRKPMLPPTPRDNRNDDSRPIIGQDTAGGASYKNTDLYASQSDYNNKVVQSAPSDQTGAYDRRPIDSYDLRRDDRSIKTEAYVERSAGGHRNPPLVDHPFPRERMSSVRSNLSDHQYTDDYERHSSQAPVKDVGSTGPSKSQHASKFDGLLQNLNAKNDKPASYSSIFGAAKPVDTSAKQLEIEKKLQAAKAAQIQKSDQQNSQTRNDGGVASSDGGALNIAPRHMNRRTNDAPGQERVSAAIGNRDRGARRNDYDDRNGGQRNSKREGYRNDGYGATDRGNNRANRGSGYQDRGDHRMVSGRRFDNRGHYEDHHGGGGGTYRNQHHSRYNEDRNRYQSGGSDYIDDNNKEDHKSINYVTSNKFDHLGETDDQGYE